MRFTLGRQQQRQFGNLSLIWQFGTSVRFNGCPSNDKWNGRARAQVFSRNSELKYFQYEVAPNSNWINCKCRYSMVIFPMDKEWLDVPLSTQSLQIHFSLHSGGNADLRPSLARPYARWKCQHQAARGREAGARPRTHLCRLQPRQHRRRWPWHGLCRRLVRPCSRLAPH